jgi:RNA polymerase sigma factor (sigma-70 family)
MKDYKNVNEEIRLKIKAVNQKKKINLIIAKKMEDALIISLEYLVHSVIFKYKRFDNYEDLYQEGMIGLIKAVQRYNTDTSFHFTRYALWWIKARVMRSIKKLNLVTISGDSKMRYFMQYDIKEHDLIDISDPEQKAILMEEIDNLNNVIETLPNKHQQIIKMRYGLKDTKEYNLQDLGDELEMTREGIRQIEHRIIKRLKNNNTFND